MEARGKGEGTLRRIHTWQLRDIMLQTETQVPCYAHAAHRAAFFFQRRSRRAALLRMRLCPRRALAGSVVWGEVRPP